MKIVKDKISLQELKEMAERSFGDLIKAVVDIEREIMVVGGELHSDEESLLIKEGSSQKNLWGINLYPYLEKEEWVEFDSIINIRPFQDNLTRSIDNPQIRNRITEIINRLVER